MLRFGVIFCYLVKFSWFWGILSRDSTKFCKGNLYQKNRLSPKIAPARWCCTTFARLRCVNFGLRLFFCTYCALQTFFVPLVNLRFTIKFCETKLARKVAGCGRVSFWLRFLYYLVYRQWLSKAFSAFIVLRKVFPFG